MRAAQNVDDGYTIHEMPMSVSLTMISEPSRASRMLAGMTSKCTRSDRCSVMLAGMTSKCTRSDRCSLRRP